MKEENEFNVGDYVFWHDPDEGKCSGKAIIKEIEGDIYRLQMVNSSDSNTEALINEVTKYQKGNMEIVKTI